MSYDQERPMNVAFYLPQYHPIPENDEWWGAGFTDWRNVVRARPRFNGHEQPQLPADLGFYDLRLSESRVAQAEMALRHGVDAFCYYHYWFHGKELLSGPLDQVISSGVPRIPFMICWANEPWSRRWDGSDHEVLQNQSYDLEDDRAHIRRLLPIFADDRYVRVEGRPVFLVYRAGALSHPVATTELWRTEAHRAGLGDLHLCRVESFPDEHGDPREIGFDASVEFQPDWSQLSFVRPSPVSRLARKLTRRPADRAISYVDLVGAALEKPSPPFAWYRCVTPRWDNSPRRSSGEATIFVGSTPERYESWLKATTEQSRNSGAPLLFVNAWNEWAEGAHLEPCLAWGRAFLEAHARGRS